MTAVKNDGAFGGGGMRPRPWLSAACVDMLSMRRAPSADAGPGSTGTPHASNSVWQKNMAHGHSDQCAEFHGLRELD